VAWNGRKVGMNDAGADMTFHFGQLIAHLCGTRPVQAGTLVGSGSVSNAPVEGPGGRADWPKGYSCIAEKRAMEILQDGQAKTCYMKFGDTVKIEMKGRSGDSVFGAIAQKVVPLHPAEPASKA
jgi:fumarylacetoacetate (FAA) hydrolase